ncbi:GNAT family N-acetyltransferase [Corynebacterium pseudotuberculosis 258]|uniref:GNAT family N-acetyltransferase n=1 Tax=Corynebacterium pseudotuberculosis 258 TaxID=1168865 RepID=A0AAU8PZC2_CORPS|nr:GNAT family protein [Corynebacterium pseudotuberculosis]AEQ06798.1 GNAT family N-acetyltransferase [Corynebacterium pseudotuberculosis CIP 52.97]AFK16893.1 GNAT family N-acetyltransferase [Corynebacterium pseudotuberculosis 258]
MLKLYQIERPKHTDLSQIEPSDLLRSFTFSSNLATQDISGDTSTSSTVSSVIQQIHGSPAQRTIIVVAVQAEPQAPIYPTGELGLEVLPCTDHSLPDSEESTIGYPVGYLEIDVPLQSNLSSISCDVILDAELQPLPTEKPGEEACECIRLLLESLPLFAEKLSRPIIQLWKLMPAEPTPYSIFLESAINSQGFTQGLEEIQGYVPVQDYPITIPQGYESLTYYDHRPPQELIDSLLALFDQAARDIPVGTLSRKPRPWTRKRLEQAAETTLRRGNQVVSTVLISQGKAIAFSEVSRRADASPSVSEQNFTIVLRDYRGKALGTLIKTLCIKEALRRWPHIKRIYTEMATYNDAMQTVNNQLGFTHVAAIRAWEKNLV